MKPEHLSTAQVIFADSNIQITARGQRHLGAALGTKDFTEEYVASKVESWTAEVSALAGIASSRPHAAYCAFTHGMMGRWVYLMRTIPNISSLLQPLEDAIRLKLFPSITGHVACATGERELFSLPCRFGGFGMGDPTAFCESQFDASLRITAPLKDLIISQVAHAHPPDTRSIKAQVHQHQREASKKRALA